MIAAMWREDPADVRPMLASIGDASLADPGFAYEPKYDGIRAIVAVEPGRRAPAVRFWSRLGNEKTAQFPEVAEAITTWAARLRRPLLLDGEIVALDEKGEPLGFQYLQGRMHLQHVPALRKRSTNRPEPSAHAILILFDILRDGDEDLRALPLRERRARLERVFGEAKNTGVRLSEQAAGDGGELHERALARGWEGLLAKKLDSIYRSGKRSPDWRKLKLVRTQTCVVAGWTDPRRSRARFGALLLGVYDDEKTLRYVGHAGSGFSDAELERVWKKLKPLEVSRCPFPASPPVNERPHWVRPRLVAEVKFTEWTSDGIMRHPTYLGLRDDVEPASVVREPDAPAARTQATRLAHRPRVEVRERKPAASPAAARKPTAVDRRTTADLLAQIDAIQARGGSGTLALPGGERLAVTNLGKVFWPARARGEGALTKGDLMRHYVRVAPAILPVLADRPLVMRRFPNGVAAKAFYQHQASDVPPGIRVEPAGNETPPREHLIGGTLLTLLYTAQLASISQDPWFSRISTPDTLDYAAIDLDPPDDLPFARVLDVARWVREECDRLGAAAFAKTSGASGLHVYVPMAPGTPFEAGLLFCQIIATAVAQKHPRAATIERARSARRGRVYVDYLQNAKGKTLASAYSARASAFAGVSAPLTWQEVEGGVAPEDFTLRTFAARLEEAGDLWAALRSARGADLHALAARRARTRQAKA